MVEQTDARTNLSDGAATTLWIALIAGSSIALSLIFACATPFAALAAIAGSKLRRIDAFLAIGAAWLANQAIGYGFLAYPRTWDSFGWGAAIGAAALLAVIPAQWAAVRGKVAVTLVAGLLCAFAVYEMTLFAATAVLPSGGGFTPAVVWYVFSVNALAFPALVLLHHAAMKAGIRPRALAASERLA